MSAHPLLHGVKAVVFDAVGTVIHPEPPAPLLYVTVGQRRSSRRSAAEVRERFVAAFAREEALDRADQWRTSESREYERWRRIVAFVFDDLPDPEACFHELYEHFGRPTAWRCAADTAATLTALAERGLALGMASNYDHRLRSVVTGLPELTGLQQLLVSAEVGWRKPAPAFFQAVERAFQLPPDQILYVGDDPANDYAGAKAAGLRALLFDPRERFPEARHASLRSLSALTGR